MREVRHEDTEECDNLSSEVEEMEFSNFYHTLNITDEERFRI